MVVEANSHSTMNKRYLPQRIGNTTQMHIAYNRITTIEVIVMNTWASNSRTSSRITKCFLMESRKTTEQLICKGLHQSSKIPSTKVERTNHHLPHSLIMRSFRMNLSTSLTTKTLTTKASKIREVPQ